MSNDTSFLTKTKEERKSISDHLLNNYPNMVPIHISRKFNYEKKIKKNKFLTPRNMTLNNFILIIRQKIIIDQYKSLCICHKDKLLNINDTLGFLFDNYKNKTDNILYLFYITETSFG